VGLNRLKDIIKKSISIDPSPFILNPSKSKKQKEVVIKKVNETPELYLISFEDRDD